MHWVRASVNAPCNIHKLVGLIHNLGTKQLLNNILQCQDANHLLFHDRQPKRTKTERRNKTPTGQNKTSQPQNKHTCSSDDGNSRRTPNTHHPSPANSTHHCRYTHARARAQTHKSRQSASFATHASVLVEDGANVRLALLESPKTLVQAEVSWERRQRILADVCIRTVTVLRA